MLWCRELERTRKSILLTGFCFCTPKATALLFINFLFLIVMQKQKEITQSPVQTINEQTSDQNLTYGANLIIDLHVLAVQANQNFKLSKKFKKLAYSLANEIANLEPKCVTLKVV